MELAGKTVIVTGAASGIGAAAVRGFAAAGANVVIADIAAEGAARVAAGIPGAMAVPCDITDADAVEDLNRVVVERHGSVDLLVNNAMFCSEQDFLDLTPAQIRRDVEVSLVGTMICTQAVLRGMVERGSGNIINVSSVNGIGYYGNPAYSAAKAGVINFTKTIAVAYGRAGVRCNAIAPGTIATDFWETRAERDPDVLAKAAAWYPSGRVGVPQDIVSAMLYLASDASEWVNGHTLVVDGGLTAGNAIMADEIVPEVGA